MNQRPSSDSSIWCADWGIAVVLVPHAFRELGVMGGFSYLTALFSAVSNATFFRVARVGRAYYPLGLVAPIAIFVGLAGSAAVRPMLGDAKNAALAQDFAGALIILAVFGVFSLCSVNGGAGIPMPDRKDVSIIGAGLEASRVEFTA